MLIMSIVPTQAQALSPALVEVHKIHLDSLFHHVQVPLDEIPALWQGKDDINPDDGFSIGRVESCARKASCAGEEH